MKVKGAIFAVLGAFLVLAMSSSSAAVDTRDIDRVRNKGVLDSRDFQIIDNFVAEAVLELVKTKDLSDIARIRTVVLSRQSSQAQYAQQFSESAHKYISLGFEEASRLTPKERQITVTLNLLILIDGLADLRLTELAIGKLRDRNTIIRYWAVHSLTNPGIIKQLNSSRTSNSRLASSITEQLKGLVESSEPEIIALIAKFAAGVNIRQGEALLLQIADMRIKRYADWTVRNELLDASVLKLLCSKLPSTGLGTPLPATSSGNPAIARRFGQLYSYVIQRYVKGKELLSDTHKRQLASVLVETENKCIGKLLGRPQSVIKKAVERNNYTALLREHNRLLGAETMTGQLVLKLKFDYGNTSGGRKRTAPLVLPEPPKLKVSN